MWRSVLVVLLVVGVGLSLWRGVLGALPSRGGSSDFALFYTASRVWAAGGNPYDIKAVAAEWGRVIPPSIWPIDQRGPVLVYPPAAFVIVASCAWMPFGAAATSWALLNAAMVAAAVCAAGRVAGLRGTAWLGFVTGCVWLAPLASALRYGQTPSVVVGCLGLGVLLRARGRMAAGGALEGVAAVFKPQLGLLFVVYELGRGRWRMVAGACAAGAALLLAGAGRMWAAGVDWYPFWRAQLHDFQSIGDGNPTRTNHVRGQMINLHYPLHSLIDDRGVVQALVYGILGALCLAYLAVDFRRGRERGEGRGGIVSLSMTAVVTLLVVYHRFYDAVILIVPLAAAVAVLSNGGSRRGARRAAWTVLLLLGAFVFPLTGQLLRLELHGLDIAGRHVELPLGVANGFLWNFVVMPHETWALLAMAGCLVWLRAVAGKRAECPAEPAASVARY